jgi:prepilin-type N-terminal cleavage/methylation domain-containing protein
MKRCLNSSHTNRFRVRHSPCNRQRGFTVLELLVVIVVLGLLLALLVPYLLRARASARQSNCVNHLKQIGLAIHNYAQANRDFPPGTISSSEPKAPSDQYDIWAEAAKTDKGAHGTSFLLPILPYLEMDEITKRWDSNYGVGHHAGTAKEPGLAVTEVKTFYCPDRRTKLRPKDSGMMLAKWWTGGGTDYGGCAGRHAAFTLKTGYNLCDASMHYDPDFVPTVNEQKIEDEDAKRWGIFGRVNACTSFAEVRDGTSNTIMIGELQRITDLTPGSKDGWAVGGPATLFTTGALVQRKDKSLKMVDSPKDGRVVDNDFWGSPGSEHSNGAHFGLADCSVRFLSHPIDPNIFALLGSMADNEAIDASNL